MENLVKFKRSKSLVKLTEVIDIEQQLEKFRNQKLDLIKRTKVYEKDSLLAKSALVKSAAEREISCLENQQVSLPLIDKEDRQKLKAHHYRQIHLGLVLIAVQGLHRKYLGTKTFVCLYDERHTDLEHSIIESYEIDMNENGALIYFVPNFTMNTLEFLEKIKLGIKTIGYDMTLNSKNLRITSGFIGKMQEHSNVRYKLDTNELEQIMISKGIRAIPGIKIDSLVNLGKEWRIESFLKKRLILPTTQHTFRNTDGSISFKFGDYKGKALPGSENDDLESLQSELEGTV